MLERKSAIANLGWHGDGSPAPDFDRRAVSVVNRIRQQHTVAGLQQGAERRIYSAGGAIRNEYLGVGVVRKALVTLQLFGNRLPQDRFALVVRIAGAAVAQRLDAGFDDVRRRRRVGLAAYQRNQCAAFGLKLPGFRKDAIDGGGSERGNSLR